MMEKFVEYLSYIIILLIIFFKSFFSLYKYVKEFFKKEKDIIVENKIISPLNDKNSSISEMFSLLMEQEKILKVLLNIDSEILKQQLDYFEKNINTIKLKILNDYCFIAYKNSQLTDSQRKLYCDYIEILLKILVLTVHNHFKYFCKQNHFNTYSVLEFNNEIKKYIQIIFNDIITILLDHKDNFQIFPNNEIILNFKSELESLLIDAFREARDISIQEHEKVDKIKQEFENHVSNLLQRKYVLGY